MSGVIVSGSGRVRVSARLIGNDCEFSCVVLDGAKGSGGIPRAILDQLRDCLLQTGIRLDLLSDFTFLNGHYIERFEELAGECVLGVLILDGLGPEELYELGYLRGRGKFILTFGNKNTADADGTVTNPSSAAGEKPTGFAAYSGKEQDHDDARYYCDKFISRHMSDIADSGPEGEAGPGDRPETRIVNDLNRALPGVIDRYVSDSLGDAGSGAEAESLRGLALRISGYFASRSGFGMSDLDEIYEGLVSWESRTGRSAPSRILRCLASLYAGLDSPGAGEDAGRECRMKLVSIYEKILEVEKPRLLAGATAKRLADLLVTRPFAEDAAGDIERAAGLYKEILGFFTKDKYPRESASVRNNLGAALSALCLKTGEPAYARQAVESIAESLSSEIFKNSPSDRALSYRNLGSAYASLAVHENPRENYLKAAEALGIALGIYKSCERHDDIAETCGALGDVYTELAGESGETPCYTQAFSAYDEALRIYSADDFPGEYADIMTRLGDARASLALKLGDPHDYEEALKAYGESLGVYTREGAAAEADTLNVRIGRVYKALGDREADSNNTDKAIEYYDEALLYYPEETARGEHAASGRKLGEAFERLYRESGDETHIRKAIAAYSEALYASGVAGDPGTRDIELALRALYTGLADQLERSGDHEGAAECCKGLLGLLDPLDYPMEYAEAQRRLGDLLAGIPKQYERALNIELAIDSYKEALGFYVEESHADVRNELRGLVGGLLTELTGYEPRDLNKRIGLYQEALEYYPSGPFPYEHALIQKALGGAHSELSFAEEPLENACKAVDYYNKALEYLSLREHRREFASAHYDLGALYARLYDISGDREFLGRSVSAYEKSSAGYTPEESPDEYEAALKGLEVVRGLISETERAMASGDEAPVVDGPEEDEKPKERPVLKLVSEDAHEREEGPAPGSGDEDNEIITLAREVEFDDPEEAAEYFEESLRRISKEEFPAEYASLKLGLGRVYGELGEAAGGANDFRKALKAYEDSLSFYTRENFPVEFAEATSGSAFSWMRLADQTGDIKGYERAAASYNEALRVVTRESSPLEWGGIKENLGNIYRTLAQMKGEAGEYRKAVAEYNEALEVFGPGEHQPEYGRIQKNIGFVYGILAGVEDRTEDYTRALDALTKALTAYGQEDAPAEYAEIHKYMGIAYGSIARKDGVPEYYGKAIDAYAKALSVITFETSPKDYGLIKRNTASAFDSLSKFSDAAQDMISAARSYEEALGYYTCERMPAEYASILSGLGTLYQRLAEKEDASGNCRNAVKCYERLLKVYNIKEYPLEYAATENNLGIIYRTLAEQEEKGKNCKRAVNAYREALRVYNDKEHPVQYGSTKNNLGTAYMTLADVEDKETNCRMARSAFEEALKVRTIQNYPMQFAATQNNLGVVYRMLSEVEDRAKNCKRAINAYETALIIYTIDRFPIQYATTQNNIGGAYTTLAEEEDRSKNCDKASEAYQEALKVFTKNSYPSQHEIVKANLELLCEFSGQRASTAAS